MNIKFDLLETKLSTEDQACGSSNCSRVIKYDDVCFIDIKENILLCEECGKCERYERKRKDQREKAGVKKIRLIKGLDY